MTRPSDSSQRGVSLIIVLLILVVVSVLGVGGAQIAMMAERGSRNDRDMQIAWQSAEAALIDAEFDIHGPNTATTSRRNVFAQVDPNFFAVGCGTDAANKNKGLCQVPLTGKPAWLTVDFTVDASTAATTAVGTFTGRSFASVAAGGQALGVQPAKVPRYIIEIVPDKGISRDVGTGSSSARSYFVYRVTAMGFGPRADIQAMTQMLYRD